jgi:hypothetical protein
MAIVHLFLILSARAVRAAGLKPDYGRGRSSSIYIRDHLDSFGTSLLGSASVEFNAVPGYPFAGGDVRENSVLSA